MKNNFKKGDIIIDTLQRKYIYLVTREPQDITDDYILLGLKRDLFAIISINSSYLKREYELYKK